MKLLKYENYTIKFEPELLTLKLFKKLHSRDRSRNKDRFMQELGYIYFMCDPRSDYQYLVDEEDRSKAIIEGEGLPTDYKPDALVEEAMRYYNTFKPTSALLLEDTRVMVDGYRKKLRELTSDMSELEVKDIKALGDIIKIIPTLVKDLDDAERSVNREMIQNDKVRGSVEKSIYEDL